MVDRSGVERLIDNLSAKFWRALIRRGGCYQYARLRNRAIRSPDQKIAPVENARGKREFLFQNDRVVDFRQHV